MEEHTQRESYATLETTDKTAKAKKIGEYDTQGSRVITDLSTN